jgi:hypothetical protein
MITLTSDDYNNRVEKGEIDPEAYYYVFDDKDNKLVYVTLKDLEATYSTTA